MTHLSEAILHNTRGVSLVLHDPLVVQFLRPHFDFFVLDCAARACSPETILSLMHAAGDKAFLVRPANNDKATLQALLNIGVDGLVLPDIHHAAELEKIIASCLYPPEGLRPYRPIVSSEKTSLEALNDQITFVVEVTHAQTIAQLEEIAEVTGVNGFLVSPQRLSIAMEHGTNAAHPFVQQALQTIARVASSYELAWGLEGETTHDFTPSFTLAQRDIDLLTANLKETPEFIEDEEEPFMLAARRE